jgi:6-hydroxycyclohex-1-ene-1-carbonyl-CoA dehydrogenase
VRVTSWTVVEPGRPMILRSREEEPDAGDVIVEVAACGVCHTDLSFYYDGVPTRRPFPLALGHEISGRVVEAGPGAEAWIGREVIVPSVIPCGACPACLVGRGQVCPAQIFPGSSVDGGFGSHIRVPARGLCHVADLEDPTRNRAGLDLVSLAVVADAVSTPYQAIARSGLSAGDLAVWVGVGGLGSFGVQIAAARGAHVVAIDLDEERLARAGKFGAALTMAAPATDAQSIRIARQQIRSFGESHGVPTWRTTIFETSGDPEGQRLAFGLLGPGSTLSVIGYTASSIDVRLSHVMAFDATVQGNWGCLPEVYPDVVDLALSGRIAIEPFIERRPMSAINEVFLELRRRPPRYRQVLINT